MKTVTISRPVKNEATQKIALLIAMILLPFFMWAQNLATNSSFDDGTSGWTGSCSVEVNPETVYGGTSASNNVTEIDMERCLDQTICIMPGVTYKLSFRATRRPDANTPNTAGISIKVKGVNSHTTYVSNTKNYNNNSWGWSTESYTFTAGNSDKSVNIHIQDYNSHSTYGVIMDDIELHPQSDMAISGSNVATVNLSYSYAVSNSPSSGITYNWNMGANATTATSTSATPSTKWTAIGNKNMTVAISNASCVVTTLSNTVLVTSLLPVNFTSFTGVIKDNKAALTWTTANEENNHFFVVERSVNGRNYDSVGRVQAGSSTRNTYAFSENNTNAISYYRLKQVDINGSYVYSPVITLKNTGSSKDMTVYPSQATSTIQYVVTSEVSATALVQVYNMTGQPVMSQQEVLQQGLNIRSLNVSLLATGAYILKLQIPARGVAFVKQFSRL
jgi:hypothetical protein